MANSRIWGVMGGLCLLLAMPAMAVPGDLNADGVVDVADALRVEEMLAGNIAANPLADVDGDGTVTATDSWLIHKAALGTPLPAFLAAATIGPAGGEVAGGGGRLVVPPGAVAETGTVSILRDTSGQGLDEGEVEGDVLLLTGLPRGVSGIEVRLALPDTGAADEWTLTAGEFLYARSAQAFAWRWRLLDRSVVTVEGNELVYTLPPLPEAPDAATRDGEAQPSLVFNRLKFAVVRNPADPGTRYYFQPYSSDHFRVYSPFTLEFYDPSNSVELFPMAKTLPLKLEVIYGHVKDLGFPLGDHQDWFPMRVYVKAEQEEDGLFFDSFLDGKYVTIRGSLLDGSPDLLHATLAHEFLHFVQSHYGATIFTSGWLDDATAVWFEKTAVGDPTYVPNVATDLSAPLSGMHRTVQYELNQDVGTWVGAYTYNPFNVRKLYNVQDSWNRAQAHGYSMSAFFEYLSNRNDWNPHFIYRLYLAIEAGRHPILAIDDALRSTIGSTLNETFEFFCADYLQLNNSFIKNHPSMKKGLTSHRIFPPYRDERGGINERGVKHNIELTSFDPFAEFEDTLIVPELGAGMVQFIIRQPRKLFPEDTVLYAEVDAEHCDALYGFAEYSTTNHEFFEGTHDPEMKRYTIAIPVDIKSGIITMQLLVYKEEEIDDTYTEAFPITVKSVFQGPLFIPPFIAFQRINDKYKHSVTASAIMHVEPGRLEKFGVFNDLSSYSDYDYTYTQFGKYATVGRKDDLPLTIKLYGDILVKTIDPFTIVVKYPDRLAPDGFSTFDWKHHDVPAPSGSGSPTISIMAYHGPNDGSITLGQEAYRILHEEVAQEDLKKANGGVDLIVPPSMPGYVYVLAVFAKYDTTLQLLYHVLIAPPAEATDE